MITAQNVLDLLLELKERGWNLSETPIVFDDCQTDKIFNQLDYDSTMGEIYINDMRDK